MADKFLFPSLKALISIEDIERKNYRDKAPKESIIDNNRENLECILQEEGKEVYQPRVLTYSDEEKYERDLYIPGVRKHANIVRHRFPLLNPIGVAYTTLYQPEFDDKIFGAFLAFVKMHEGYHIKEAEGYDEHKTTMKAAYQFQLITGYDWTFLPK